MGGLTLDLAHAKKLGSDDPLVRAVGKEARVVVDATAGLGRDAAALAVLGISVVAVERNATVAQVWSSSMARAPRTLSFLHGDARDVLRAFASCGLRADCVLIDPMYPDDDKRTAAPQRELALLRAVVGDDADAADLARVALEVCRRVVVKRPRKAAPLLSAAPSPSHSWIGASTRYDLYLAAPRDLG